MRRLVATQGFIAVFSSWEGRVREPPPLAPVSPRRPPPSHPTHSRPIGKTAASFGAGRGQAAMFSQAAMSEAEIDDNLRKHGWWRKPVPKDGSCFFRAVAETIFHTQVRDGPMPPCPSSPRFYGPVAGCGHLRARAHA